ncbi:PqiA/YebS family transporter subunit [Orrella sp. JC864]|uniref:PqiA/YebS family transporter subunit n=1 Tax=Orrella sp. JC864 TaxID=3120298 RepID=UPI00300B893F
MRAADSGQDGSPADKLARRHAFHVERVACDRCGAIYGPFKLAVDETASCPLCRAELCKHDNFPVQTWLALSLAGLMVFVLANLYPVAVMRVSGMARSATLLQAVGVTWRQGYEAVALMSLLAGFVLPFMLLAATLWVLIPLSQNRLAPGFVLATRFIHAVSPWCMVQVFLLGALVAVIKLADMAAIQAGAGLYAFAALMVLLTLLRRIDARVLWRHAHDQGLVAHPEPHAGEGEALTGCAVCGLVQAVPVGEKAVGCLRCRAPVRFRKPDHVGRTWALIAAAAILYVPANLLPVMHVTTLFGGTTTHTIMGGVVDLWRAGSMDVAVIVFIASVVVPLTKLLALAALLVAAQRDSTENLRARTRLYETVEFIGQWSMLDVFVVVLLSALADFPGLSQIHAGSGAAAFGLVVLLTMLAAMSYDPRRAWDAAVDELDLGSQSAAPRGIGHKEALDGRT